MTKRRIESLGLPGSGKSTLVGACRDRMASLDLRDLDAVRLDRIDQKKSPQMPVLWPQERIRQAYSLSQFVLRWPDAVAFFQGVYADNPRNLTIIHAIGADHVRFERGRKALPFWVDEGFFHYGVHAIMTLDPAQDAASVDQLVGACPLPDTLIVTHADPDQALAGIRQRAGLDAGDAKKDKRFFDRFGSPADFARRARIIDAIAQGLSDRGVQILTLAAHGPLDQMVDQVMQDLDLGGAK